MDYIKFHEQFMQNNNGTTASDVLINILPSAFTTVLARHLILYLGLNNAFCKFVIEYCIIIIPVVLLTTVLADFRNYWFIVSTLVCLFFCFKPVCLKEVWKYKVDRRKRWQCISNARVITLLLTSYAILAVDFNVFPRYFAKTERFGYSLMDVGVGLFVFCNALVPSKVSRHSLYKSLEVNVKQCAALVVLGVGRLILTKSINYQEHVTEYGVHWNFFLTLAITRVVTTFIMCVFKEEHSLISGIFLLTAYEIILNNGLSDWVFSDAPRINFIYANREGLVSCVGYVSLHLISSYIGQTVRENFDDKKQGNVIKTLAMAVVFSWFGVHLTESYLTVSRCLANAGYCLFTLAVGTTTLFVLYIFDITDPTNKAKDIKPKKLHNESNPSIIYTAINNNGLLYFLLSNVTTGLINMSFKTLLLNTISSLFIIFLYMIIVPTLVILYQKKNETKYFKNKLM